MNRTLTLVRYATIEGKGWRHGAVVFNKNGKLKADVMMIGGREVYCPTGRYQMVKYRGVKPIYTNLGEDPTDALNRFRAEEKKRDARTAAIAAGIAAGLEVVTPEESTRKTIKQYASDFLAMHRNLPHRSDDSVRVYTQITSTFLAACKATYPEDVTQDDVLNWYGKLRKDGYADRTRSTLYKSLRGFLKYCGVEPRKLIEPGTHKLLKKYTKRIPNTYTMEQVQALIAASTDGNRALLWDFAHKTGLRNSELQHVTRWDVHGLDTDDPRLHVKERDEYGRIKDAEEREIELHPSLVAPIKKWLKTNPKRTLLFGTANDKPDTKMLLALKATARRAGLDCGRCAGCTGKRQECGEYTMHRFRRTYTTRMLQATGGDLRSVMARTGHSDIASVMRYLAPSATIRAAVNLAF